MQPRAKGERVEDTPKGPQGDNHMVDEPARGIWDPGYHGRFRRHCNGQRETFGELDHATFFLAIRPARASWLGYRRRTRAWISRWR
jgi:hypothetical protein